MILKIMLSGQNQYLKRQMISKLTNNQVKSKVNPIQANLLIESKAHSLIEKTNKHSKEDKDWEVSDLNPQVTFPIPNKSLTLSPTSKISSI